MASQVEAPVIDLYRGEKRLVAHGDAGQDGAVVRTLLVRDRMRAKAAVSGGASVSGSGKKTQGPLRVVSREMVYTDAARTVEFTGGVRAVDDRDGTLVGEVRRRFG